MSPQSSSPSRRSFLKTSSSVAAASTVLSTLAPRAYAADENTLQLALVGCGGRGTGAATNALSVDNGPIKLVAMADVFESNMANSFGNLNKSFGEKGNHGMLPQKFKMFIHLICLFCTYRFELVSV